MEVHQGLISKDITSGEKIYRHGVSVAIYTKDILNLREMSQIVPENVETVCLQAPLSSKLYNANFMDDLENYLHTLDEQDKELILLTGDLNCDRSLSVLQSHSRKLLDILELLQMKQVIPDATRITSNTASLLDIIATK